MIPEDLRERLDAITQEHPNNICKYLRYAVEARAGYALVEALEAGIAPEAFGGYGSKASQGIVIPLAALQNLIYIPNALVEVDAAEKSRDEYNGVALFSADQVNAFFDGEGLLKEDLVYVVRQQWNGEELLSHLHRNWALRGLAKEYSRAFISRVKDLIAYETGNDAMDAGCANPELPLLAFQLVHHYADEMDVRE